MDYDLTGEEDAFWTQLPLRRESRRMTVFESVRYQNALRKNFTYEFNEELFAIARSNQNIEISFIGPPGCGKSTLMFDTAEKYLKYHDPPKELRIETCHLSPTRMLEWLEAMKPKDVAMLDEQIFTAGQGSQAERMALKNIEMTVRAQEISLFFAAPQLFIHSHHYILEPWEMGSPEEWDFSIPIENQWKFTKSIIFSSDTRPIGFVISSSPKNQEFMKDYKIKKDNFITQVRSQGGGHRPEFVEGKIKALLGNQDFIAEFSNSENLVLKRHVCALYLKTSLLTRDEINLVAHRVNYYLKKSGKDLNNASVTN